MGLNLSNGNMYKFVGYTWKSHQRQMPARLQLLLYEADKSKCQSAKIGRI